MKTRLRILFTMVLTLYLYICNAQTTIKYEYDNAGNRIERYNPDIPLKSNILVNSENSIFNEKTEELKEDFDADEFFEEELEKQKITIFPNPTGGQMVVQITPLNTGTVSKLELFDISGKRIIKRKNLGEYTDINISSSPSGEYIMHISIGNEVSVWKIIKE